MKVIIIGLGNFGAALGKKMSKLGHEIIGVDNNIQRVEGLKDKLSYTICLDATDEIAINKLPLNNTDIVIISIGENEGANIMATAIFKNKNVKRLISRSINSLHENVLQAIGVSEIIRPEAESAERWTKKLNVKGVVDSFELNKEFSIIEVVTPDELVGKTFDEIQFKKQHNILVMTIIQNKEEASFLGQYKIVPEVQGFPSSNTVIKKNDVLVIYGANEDIYRFLKKYNIQ
ncbi:trk system potassium uptake protein TrkA [Algoriella xinjiangensis]|uniref:Trk system potassium uptake protein TrkA n=1 Tax=Algoriella xinjiangensis TaxID=684065 RepID=A0A1I4WPI5_9FLAO|nr:MULTISPECIES: TrkA family potassium uptake protein [Algoriella]MBO6211994.1 TrkA family potassium uptake protein [Algoriella sp.]SFN15731.1 trk system potassium uptake protein TrkA [Algoriella xinjiangensis]VDH16752.1 Ktr system potassium uptake protein A [Algoriella xinjiangensis]